MVRQTCFVAMCITVCVLCACSTFQQPPKTDPTTGVVTPGKVVVAPDPTKIEAGGQVAAGTVSTIPVWGQIAGALILLATTYTAAHYRGKEVGWTQAVGTPATPAVPGEASIKT